MPEPWSPLPESVGVGDGDDVGDSVSGGLEVILEDKVEATAVAVDEIALLNDEVIVLAGELVTEDEGGTS